MTISIVAADDHEVIRLGLAKLFEGTDVTIVAEASCEAELLKVVRQSKPQLVLLDVRFEDGNGLAVLEEFRKEFPEIAVIVLSSYDHPTYIARASALGASDYVVKGATRDELLASIHAAVLGQALPEKSLMGPIREYMRRPPRKAKDSLGMSPREVQVLRHLALGLSNREISFSLGVSIDTVKEHVQRAVHKLGVSDRTQAAVIAVKQGLVG